MADLGESSRVLEETRSSSTAEFWDKSGIKIKIVDWRRSHRRTTIAAMNANHCRSDEREPPLQAIIDAAATNGEKTGRAHWSEWVRHRWLVMFALFMHEVKGRGDPGD
ncbi:hypothetical protein DEO72_LG8g1624 [Vigna unguiculata]|uniref:Uncharacterized protein n=1 Tax=Vigna unguiculata TaxID=3917 RepID=A0A4D6MU11_VIGUN|nr:hypothetical protein DEO72_LG8g1624 [Vigna unguiculata]